MNFKLLDEWMSDYEEQRFSQLMRTKELRNKWKEAKLSQKILNVNSYNREDPNRVEIPEMKQCACWKISPNWERVEDNTIIDNIEVEGNFYKDYVYSNHLNYTKMKAKYNGLENLLIKNGCSLIDNQWLEIKRADEDIRNKAHKEMLRQKEEIEKKVENICGEEITEIDDSKGEIFVKGSNSRVAHIYAIFAGGNNEGVIVNVKHGQRLHIRVLVKEIK